MTRVLATTSGLYPLPDWAKDDLADLKGHQRSDLIDGSESDAVLKTYEQAREEVIERQQTAGLDRIVEGQLRWDDMIAHPLAVHDAVETRGIVRYYDNNNFYREPVVQGDLTTDGDVGAELDAAAESVDEGLQAVLPGPYSLAELATDEYYGDDASFLDAIAEFLAGETATFPDVETLFLLEPSLVTDPPSERGRVREALDTISGAIDADVVAHTYWGGLEGDTHAELLDADIDAIGYDLVSDPDQTRQTVAEYGSTEDVALGVVDGQNTLVESPEQIRETIDSFLESTATDIETVYATTNTEMFYLPVNKFETKLESLAGAATEEIHQ